MERTKTFADVADDSRRKQVMAEYIEREALMEYASKKIKEGEVEMAICDKNDLDFCTGRTCGYMVMKNLFTILPAADVAPVVHGRWLPCGFGKEIMCSVCRGELDDVWEYRHCPNCGARMDGE